VPRTQFSICWPFAGSLLFEWTYLRNSMAQNIRILSWDSRTATTSESPTWVAVKISKQRDVGSKMLHNLKWDKAQHLKLIDLSSHPGQKINWTAKIVLSIMPSENRIELDRDRIKRHWVSQSASKKWASLNGKSPLREISCHIPRLSHILYFYVMSYQAALDLTLLIVVVKHIWLHRSYLIHCIPGGRSRQDLWEEGEATQVWWQI
jgi:hypothetical protein